LIIKSIQGLGIPTDSEEQKVFQFLPVFPREKIDFLLILDWMIA